MPDPQVDKTPSVIDNVILLAVWLLLALAILAAIIYLVVKMPETYVTGLITGTLAPALLLALKRIYDVQNG